MQEWTIGLCVLGIGCAVAEQLVPEGAVKRVFSVLIAVAFFGCLLSPISAVFRYAGGWLGGVKTEAPVSTTLSETVQEQLVAALEERMCRDAEERLETHDVSVRRVRLYRDKTRADSIYIERADVVFAQEDYPLPDGVEQQLEQAWGTALEVYYVQ